VLARALDFNFIVRRRDLIPELQKGRGFTSPGHFGHEVGILQKQMSMERWEVKLTSWDANVGKPAFEVGISGGMWGCSAPTLALGLRDLQL
jgi:hypothetical protein